MKHILLSLVFGCIVIASPVFTDTQVSEATGTGQYLYGEGLDSPTWDFSIAGTSCQSTVQMVCAVGAYIDGQAFQNYVVSLHPATGQQLFYIFGIQNGQVALTQEYETYGTMTSDTCTSFGAITEYMCTETFTFDAVAQSPEFIFSVLSQTNSVVQASVPEPSTGLLLLAATIMLGCLRYKRKR